jgi:hypothetical protein
MKKIVFIPVGFFLIVLLVSCKKGSQTSGNDTENSTQTLYKIVQTRFYASGPTSSETIDYEYDDAGKIIVEGAKHYYRDDKERIIKITMPPNSSNRRTIYVHYADASSKTVAYTICHFNAPPNTGISNDSLPGHDSIVYQHENGRLIKMLEYFSGDGISFAADFYHTLSYDEKGNLRQVSRIGDNCLIIYRYNVYDDRVNPQYSDDEVRILETFWGMGNISPNNLISGNSVGSNHFEYRADGRPRSCTVSENGRDDVKITYHYK